jgi:hypothetical protein
LCGKSNSRTNKEEFVGAYCNTPLPSISHIIETKR